MVSVIQSAHAFGTVVCYNTYTHKLQPKIIVMFQFHAQFVCIETSPHKRNGNVPAGTVAVASPLDTTTSLLHMLLTVYTSTIVFTQNYLAKIYLA